MTTDIMVEWAMTQDDAMGSADIVVFDDGRVSLSERLGGGKHQLTSKQLDTLRTFLFQEQQLTAIDEQAINREVEAAAARIKSQSGSKAIFVRQPQRDSGTTFIRAHTDGHRYVVHYYDLVGDAQVYPEVEDLQRLRRIELKLLELARSLSDW